MAPFCDDTALEAYVIIGGRTAPPNTAVIINPEISFSLSGRAFRASENITENMLDIPYPMHPTRASSRIFESAKNIAKAAARLKTIWILKYVRGFIFASMAVPAKAPIVRHAKYTLGTRATSATDDWSLGSRFILSISSIGEPMFIPISIPTTATIPINSGRTVLSDNSANVPERDVDCAVFSLLMSVA